MSVSVVIVGVNDWDKYTRPLLEDLKDQDVEVICIDNGSNLPYPELAEIMRIDNTVSYAEALNYGMAKAAGDWIVATNNDVRVYNKIKKRIEELDPNKLYGFYIHNDVGMEYLSGWCYIISREIYETVGDFDTNFKPMYFEDADYSIRCVKAGFELSCLDRKEWGIIHDPDRGSERSNIKHNNMVVHKRNLNYLAHKHGFRLGNNMRVTHD